MDVVEASRRHAWALAQVGEARVVLIDALRKAKEKHTYEELGKMIGVSRQRVHQMLNEDK
jgi:DNA-directed RNA polymerase sigma subunit (sigma70/sigma32)